MYTAVKPKLLKTSRRIGCLKPARSYQETAAAQAALSFARFHIKPLPKKGGVDWFQLVPKKASRDFRRIDLGLDARGNLRNMTMYDQLGQRTEISLNTQNNVPISGKTFYFEPPRGADVIGKAR